VDTAIWSQVRDAAPVPNFASSFQSGVFFHDGAPKPAYQAFRFPFVSERRGKDSKKGKGKRIRAWGKAPTPGTVTIERRRRGGWRTLKKVSAGPNRIFVTSIKLNGAATLRATIDGEASLPWRQR
jgi:hypothetical protein